MTSGPGGDRPSRGAGETPGADSGSAPTRPPAPPGGGPAGPPDPPPGDAPDPDAEGEPIGPFPTWNALYATVLVWWATMIVILYVFTLLFDRSAS